VLRAIELLEPEALVTTPSYAAYLAERIQNTNSVKRILVAGEPGGGEPAFRAALVVQTEIELVPFGTLERSDYKARLVEVKPSASDA
jgi:phenylacetate-coenzyme A ligase PaaK-like adenylate-forming protein